ncbi:MAG: sulfotransferase family 2 domain-containing protein [Cyanobacteria bacterium P01_C01_bin.72]
MILSHRHKFIFFCNPKTGSTSVEKALAPFQEGQAYNYGLRQHYSHSSNQMLFPNKHIPPATLKAWLPHKIWNEYHKFVFVRNPWDWFVSEWKYHFRLNALNTTDFIKRPRAAAAYCKNYYWLRKLNQKQQFEVKDIDFLFTRLKNNFPVFPNTQGLFQSHYAYDLDGNKIVDFVAKFENIQDDFQKIKDDLGLEIDLMHLNKTKHDSYQSYFTKDSRQRVAELWRDDIERFGYTFN